MFQANMLQTKSSPRIVCAANSDSKGNVILGIRHCDFHMRESMKLHAMEANLLKIKTSNFYIQGFVDQFGIFYTRTDAWKIASAAGQILRRCGGDDANGGTLYSENLY